MKFAKIFFGAVFFFGSVFCFSGFVFAQTTSCTHSGQTGTCVLSSSDCANGSVYGGTECTGNNERTLCCVLNGSGGSEGGPCTSPGGQSGRCYNTCPENLSFTTRSPACSSRSVGINCCVARSDGGGGGGQCTALNSYCKSDCANYGGANSACSGACEGSAATRGLTYCNRSTSGSGGGDGGSGTDTSTGWTGGLAAVTTESGLPKTSVSTIVSNFMIWMLTLLGFIAIIGFVIAGILYLTAAGNDGQIKTAKTAMTWSIVGVIVALLGYVVIQAVDWWLGGETTF